LRATAFRAADIRRVVVSGFVARVSVVAVRVLRTGFTLLFFAFDLERAAGGVVGFPLAAVARTSDDS
jgi:hypothetical protein